MKNSPHFPSDAYMRRKSLYFSYRSRGRPTKQCQAKMRGSLLALAAVALFAIGMYLVYLATQLGPLLTEIS